MCRYWDQVLCPKLAIIFFIRPTASNQDFTTSKVTLWKPKNDSSLDSWLCTKHSMPRRNSHMQLIQTSILHPRWSTTKECIQMQISNNKWRITTTRIFYYNSSASLYCINELCCEIDSSVAIVHKNFTLQHHIETLKFGRMQHVKFIAWNKWKIRKPKQCEITATILSHKILRLQLRG